MISSRREVSLSLPPTRLLKPDALMIVVEQAEWKVLKKQKSE